MNTPEVTQPPTAVVGVTPGELAADVTAYRRELRHFLRTEPQLDAWRVDPAQSTEEILQSHARLLALLYSAGWNRYGWPPAVAGLGGSEIHRAVLYEELSMADLPIPEQCMTLDTVGPAVLGFAPELAAKLLPGYLRGAEWWGQAFSEPDAGSDLAALRTRGSIDNDRMIISGQKIWTSQGATATRLLCLVRTGAPESRHRGLTIVLVDTDCPGITIRPIALASGQRELAEVFFDDVDVPLERVIGKIDGGWAVAMYLMQWERAMYCYASTSRLMRSMRRLRDEMMAHDIAGAAQTAAFARIYVQVLTARARGLQSLRRLASGQALGPEASIDKLLCGQADKAAHDLVADVMEAASLVAAPTDRRYAHDWAVEWWYSRAATIMGGSAEIQRGIIADHVLALPKD
ncbi:MULTISPECIES: acyl-CoA dehydrogenase family protein [Mycolicibacter]|uniref:Acyl-CoA dehydrogenase n=1 Tax=Mycolicibacter kumamotonensis TaxID=354243 RepID=A0A7K3L6X9_9MYCO|nr:MULTISPECIES: acyl-CoA dehydrogenase family protein [Mycolicibacter]NDJ88012.1 acyl-CoA dehydrogenase [Mycolicibacter kumamotonensis]RAV02862.1 acyl-CoA dehydrogenase [Mycolicibacter senuensis]